MKQLQLPILERLVVRNAPSEQAELVLDIVAANRQFPSLISFSWEAEFQKDFLFENRNQWSNKTLRHLAINGRRVSNYQSFLQAFPNLFHLKIKLVGSPSFCSGSFAPYFLLNCIQATVDDDLLPHLERLLASAPNVKQFYLRGELEWDDIVEQFEHMAYLFIRFASLLVKFDCQLFCYVSDRSGDESVIREIHPLFRNIQYLLGPDENRCYATDIQVYPERNEFQRKYDRDHLCVFAGYPSRSLHSTPTHDPCHDAVDDYLSLIHISEPTRRS